MSTSDKGGLIVGDLIAANLYGNQPVRASQWQTFANNWNHTADERSRVLVCWSPRSTTTGGYTNKATNTWERLVNFGPFPLLVGADGAPYPVRVAVGGRSTASSKLRIGVCLQGYADVQMSFPTPLAMVVESASFNNGTNLWRADGIANVNAFFTDYAIPNAINGGDPSSVAAVFVTVEVWGYGAASSVTATQAYAAEQVAL
jgi:hypothetical protein